MYVCMYVCMYERMHAYILLASYLHVAIICMCNCRKIIFCSEKNLLMNLMQLEELLHFFLAQYFLLKLYFHFLWDLLLKRMVVKQALW